MKRFSKLGNYAEYSGGPGLESEIKPSLGDPRESIQNLEDGIYDAKWYGTTFELKDGRCYKTKITAKRKKLHRNIYEKFEVKGGDIHKLTKLKTGNFSGFAEIGAGLQGASYGEKPTSPSDVTRLSIDCDGFHIPSNVQNAFQIKNKRYSMINDRDGAFTGKRSNPQITISRDNSIIRTKKSGSRLDDPNDNPTPSMPNKMSNLALEWNKSAAFHLAVEPWLTSNLLSDTDDGLYLGHIKGDKIDTGEKVITLMVSIKVDYPEAVLVLIKNKKAFVFKQSMLMRSSGSKIFSNVLFSEIKSEEQFRDYAHNLMANAHKGNYDSRRTDKVASGILSTSKSYGEAVGRLKSSIKKSKSYSEDSNLFQRLDSNKDGEISKSEWDDEFKRVDKNNNDVITRDEWKDAGRSDVDFDMIDSDGDGQISKSEWDHEFNRVDLDHDGTITEDEFNAAYSDIKEYLSYIRMYADKDEEEDEDKDKKKSEDIQDAKPAKKKVEATGKTSKFKKADESPEQPAEAAAKQEPADPKASAESSQDPSSEGDQSKSGDGGTAETGKSKFKKADDKSESEQAAPANAPNAFKTSKPDESQVQSIDPNKPQEQVNPEESSKDNQSTEEGEDKPKSDEVDYKFEVEPTEPVMEMQAVVGTVMMSVSYIHLFHLITTDYATHKALQEYYEKMPELVDTLAENYLATTPTTNFKICIVPSKLDPIHYLENLQEFVEDYRKKKLADEALFSSLVDDVLKLIGTTLYRLKRLKSGRRFFSLPD